MQVCGCQKLRALGESTGYRGGGIKMSIIGLIMVGGFVYMLYDIGRVYAEKRAEKEGE